MTNLFPIITAISALVSIPITTLLSIYIKWKWSNPIIKCYATYEFKINLINGQYIPSTTYIKEKSKMRVDINKLYLHFNGIKDGGPNFNNKELFVFKYVNLFLIIEKQDLLNSPKRIKEIALVE